MWRDILREQFNNACRSRLSRISRFDLGLTAGRSKKSVLYCSNQPLPSSRPGDHPCGSMIQGPGDLQADTHFRFGATQHQPFSTVEGFSNPRLRFAASWTYDATTLVLLGRRLRRPFYPNQTPLYTAAANCSSFYAFL